MVWPHPCWEIQDAGSSVRDRFLVPALLRSLVSQQFDDLTKTVITVGFAEITWCHPPTVFLFFCSPHVGASESPLAGLCDRGLVGDCACGLQAKGGQHPSTSSRYPHQLDENGFRPIWFSTHLGRTQWMGRKSTAFRTPDVRWRRPCRHQIVAPCHAGSVGLGPDGPGPRHLMERVISSVRSGRRPWIPCAFWGLGTSPPTKKRGKNSSLDPVVGSRVRWGIDVQLFRSFLCTTKMGSISGVHVIAVAGGLEAFIIDPTTNFSRTTCVRR